MGMGVRMRGRRAVKIISVITELSVVGLGVIVQIRARVVAVMEVFVLLGHLAPELALSPCCGFPVEGSESESESPSPLLIGQASAIRSTVVFGRTCLPVRSDNLSAVDQSRS